MNLYSSAPTELPLNLRSILAAEEINTPIQLFNNQERLDNNIRSSLNEFLGKPDGSYLSLGDCNTIFASESTNSQFNFPLSNAALPEEPDSQFGSSVAPTLPTSASLGQETNPYSFAEFIRHCRDNPNEKIIGLWYTNAAGELTEATALLTSGALPYLIAQGLKSLPDHDEFMKTMTTTYPEVRIGDSNSNNIGFTTEQLVRLLFIAQSYDSEHPFPMPTPEQIANFAAIARHESGGQASDPQALSRPGVVNGLECIGLWQIYYRMHSGSLENIGIDSPQSLRIPIQNARAALGVSSDFKIENPTYRFMPWESFKHGYHSRTSQYHGSYLDQANEAIESLVNQIVAAHSTN